MGTKRFKELYEEASTNFAKCRMLSGFIGKNPSPELFQRFLEYEEHQYYLYSEMISEIMLNGFTEEFYDNLVVILSSLKGLEFSIFEMKRHLAA